MELRSSDGRLRLGEGAFQVTKSAFYLASWEGRTVLVLSWVEYMSLAVLIKKTQAQQNLSAHGFSSVGTIRGLNPTGRQYLNSTVRTPMKGTVARGYGGCCGTYVRSVLSNCTICTPGTGVATETSSAVLDRKTRPLRWVASAESPSYEDYIRKVRVYNSCSSRWPPKPSKPLEEGCCVSARIGSKLINRNTYYHEPSGAMTANEYTTTSLYRNNCLPPPSCKGPFPPAVNPRECAVHAVTPSEAIRLGLLPPDWGKCVSKYPGNSAFSVNPYERT